MDEVLPTHHFLQQEIFACLFSKLPFHIIHLHQIVAFLTVLLLNTSEEVHDVGGINNLDFWASQHSGAQADAAVTILVWLYASPGGHLKSSYVRSSTQSSHAMNECNP